MLQTILNENTMLVKVSTDIHFENSHQLEVDLVEFIVPNETVKMVIDFKNVGFIDSTGISYLIKWLHPLSEKIPIEIIGASEPVKKILEICKIDQFVKVV
jgi:anti-anti-sigma factor